MHPNARALIFVVKLIVPHAPRVTHHLCIVARVDGKVLVLTNIREQSFVWFALDADVKYSWRTVASRWCPTFLTIDHNFPLDIRTNADRHTALQFVVLHYVHALLLRHVEHFQSSGKSLGSSLPLCSRIVLVIVTMGVRGRPEVPAFDHDQINSASVESAYEKPHVFGVVVPESNKTFQYWRRVTRQLDLGIDDGNPFCAIVSGFIDTPSNRDPPHVVCPRSGG